MDPAEPREAGGGSTACNTPERPQQISARTPCRSSRGTLAIGDARRRLAQRRASVGQTTDLQG